MKTELQKLYEQTRPVPGKPGARVDREGREWYSSAWLEPPRLHLTYDEGFDAGRENVLGEIVCNICGRNHDRDESAACEGCDPITFEDFSSRRQGRGLPR